MRFHPGFTLAEVLIALAMLGIIAAFSVPKILQTVENQHKKAVFQETLALMQQLAIEGTIYRNSPLNATASNTLADYYLEKFNVLKVCSNNYVTENCYPSGVSGISDDNEHTVAIILANGAIIMDLDKFETISTYSSCQEPLKQRCFDAVSIDYNGTKPPNVEGIDAMRVIIGFGLPGTWNTTWGGGMSITTGKVMPNPNQPKSVALFNQMKQGN